MKILSLLMLTVFLGKSCQGQTNIDIETTKIEYTANSRGLYKNILVQNKTKLVTLKRGEKAIETKISDADWKIVVNEFKKIDLESMPTLKSPTEKRLYDGAAMANLKIEYNGKTYESQTFDHGYPPEPIKKIVTKLVSFTEK